MSESRTSYDGLEFGATPTKGNPSKVEIVKDRAGARPSYATVSKAVHDIHGRVTEGTDAAGSVTRTKFTPLTGGPVTQIEATSPPTPAVPKGMVTTTQIEPAFGQVTTVTDANNRTTETAYDPLGGYDSTTYRYNQAGYLSDVVAPGNAVWRFGYDLRGNKIRTEDPDSGVATMTYDDARRLATTTDARGITLAVAYDTLSRKTATHEGSLNGPKLTEWVYDTARGGKGQLKVVPL